MRRAEGCGRSPCPFLEPGHVFTNPSVERNLPVKRKPPQLGVVEQQTERVSRPNYTRKAHFDVRPPFSQERANNISNIRSETRAAINYPIADLLRHLGDRPKQSRSIAGIYPVTHFRAGSAQ